MINLVYSKSKKRLLSISTGILVATLVIMLLLSGCGDTCKTTVTYITYSPVFANMSDLRDEVEILPPQARESQGKIYIYGQYLLLGEPEKGIHVFNNADESNPVNLSFISIPGNHDMAVRNGRLYADSYIDLLVFDISNPNNITLANRLEGVFPSYNNAFGVWTDGEQVVTAMEEQEVIEVSQDCADNSPGVLWMANDVVAFEAASIKSSGGPTIGTGGSMARFAIVDSYLYAVDMYQMHIFNVTASENPVDESTIDLGWDIETIFPYKNNLFIGSMSGMFVYNIDNPAQPVYMSSVSHINTCDPVVANDTYAFVTLRSEDNEDNWCGNTNTNQLDVIDITDVTNAQLLYEFDMTGPYGLGLDGNILFVTEGDNGLKIFDITDVSKINENMIQHLTGFNAFDVIPNNGTLILTGNDGLYQFDYTDLDEIKLLSLIPASH